MASRRPSKPQIGQPATVHVGVAQIRLEPERQARLADPAGPDQGQQPSLGVQLAQPAELSLASDEAVDVARYISNGRIAPRPL